MTDKKTDWDSIPSIGGLSVDWEYEPENPLGKRAAARIDDKDLRALLGVKRVPARVLGKQYDEKGLILDIAAGGVAVLVPRQLQVGQPAKVGFILGDQKVVSNALVRNLVKKDDGYRLGLEFVDLKEEFAEAIAAAVASKAFKSL